MAPKQKPGKSKQDYGTPNEFLFAVKELLNIEDFAWDLAASHENKVTQFCYTEQDDALRVDLTWMHDGWNWLNPPYAKIEPWVQRAAFERHNKAKTAVLVPSSVGSNWWFDYVVELAHVLFLRDRITFVGAEDPYPKDLALLLYRPDLTSGYSYWDWKLTAGL